MFILRRRSDGKFFRNKGYHQDGHGRGRHGEDDPRWVDDPNSCKPFATLAGLRISRGVTIGTPDHVRWPEPGTHPDEVKHLFKVRGEWYSKGNKKVRLQWEQDTFNRKYEAVPVNIVTVHSSTT